jgi:AraC-like DNA-binding protein
LLSDLHDARHRAEQKQYFGLNIRVGMALGKWRQQLRLMQAVRLLAEGAKVTHAALDAGYNSPSAFISMFRKTLGTTPALYFQAAGTPRGNA